ncbi:MAG: carbonic anhydrase [Synechocystis sp.]|nr:carbonic anhydrase [Synechocystis sp.]
MPDFKAFKRRQLLQYGGGFLGVSLTTTILGKDLLNPSPVKAEETTINSPDEALQALVTGNNRFVNNKRINPHQTQTRLTEVAQGQAPFAAILGCADSRVPTEIVFDQGLGDLFVCRVAGNVASAQEIGSLEFGTVVLGAKVILVLGHESCGAVQAAKDGGDLPGQIGDVVKKIDIGKGSNNLEQATKANVTYQVDILKQSALLGELIAQGKLIIVGGYYQLSTGQVSLI